VKNLQTLTFLQFQPEKINVYEKNPNDSQWRKIINCFLISNFIFWTNFWGLFNIKKYKILFSLFSELASCCFIQRQVRTFKTFLLWIIGEKTLTVCSEKVYFHVMIFLTYWCKMWLKRQGQTMFNLQNIWYLAIL
jgi:hypothetical protein